MNTRLVGGLLGLFLVPLSAFAAVTVVECVDAAGASSFRDKCPPGTTKKGDRKLAVPGKKEVSVTDIAKNNPVVLYTVQNCDACDLVRNQLSSRGVPFTEKSAQDDATIQEEMKTRTGGTTVPAVVVGSTVLTGYSHSGLDNALNQAGYPPPAGAPAPAKAAPAPPAGGEAAASN